MDKVENLLKKIKKAIGLKCETTLSEFQKAKLIHEFEVFIDFNKDGVLQWKDLESARESICEKSGWSKTSKEREHCRQLFVSLWRNLLDTGDMDHDGNVSVDEWLALWLKLLAKKEENDENVKSKKVVKDSKTAKNATDSKDTTNEKDCDDTKDAKDTDVATVGDFTWLDNYIKYKFFLLDRAGDGIIDEEEYEYVLNDFEVEPQHCRNAFRIITQNGALKLDFEYFKSLSMDFYFSNNPADLGNFINGKLTYDASSQKS